MWLRPDLHSARRDELRLERVKEALHRSIVIAVALAAHRPPEAGGLHQRAVICRGLWRDRNGGSGRHLAACAEIAIRKVAKGRSARK